MEITNKWKLDGKDVVSKWITSKDYKRFKPITQVYGTCFTKEGKILIVKDLRNWKLPGGTPEKNEKPEETLRREVLEEASVVLGKCKMIGCQEVLMDEKIFYQLRYAAIIEEIKKLKPDHDTGRTMKRKFVKPSEFNKYVKWGDIGDSILRLSLEEFKKWKTILK